MTERQNWTDGSWDWSSFLHYFRDQEESDTTEWLHFHFSLSCIGEGNGNPFQYSCLENPMDRGAWQVAAKGVTESDTTKWLSMKPEIKLPTYTGSHTKKQENTRETSTSASSTMLKPLTVWKILQEDGITDHLTCLLGNLYAGQGATVKPRHGTTNWFQIGKGVC